MRYFSAGFKPFDSAFGGILDRISLYEGSVHKDIDLLRIQRMSLLKFRRCMQLLSTVLAS